MDNVSIEFDGARAILSTYQTVNDAPYATTAARLKLQKKNKELTSELKLLKEKYMALQCELLSRDKRLANLKTELVDKTSYLSKLQEDFENALYQLKKDKAL